MAWAKLWHNRLLQKLSTDLPIDIFMHSNNRIANKEKIISHAITIASQKLIVFLAHWKTNLYMLTLWVYISLRFKYDKLEFLTKMNCIPLCINPNNMLQANTGRASWFQLETGGAEAENKACIGAFSNLSDTVSLAILIPVSFQKYRQLMKQSENNSWYSFL